RGAGLGRGRRDRGRHRALDVEARDADAHSVRALPRPRRARGAAGRPPGGDLVDRVLPGVIAVGLTGGIGAGKSTVAGRLAALGASIVDTDEVARHLTGPAGAAMEQLRREFGAKYVTPEGSLDRDAMRSLAFEDAGARARLEAILHPAIRAESDARIARATGPYVVIVVPLLFETRGYRDRVARV